MFHVDVSWCLSTRFSNGSPKGNGSWANGNGESFLFIGIVQDWWISVLICTIYKWFVNHLLPFANFLEGPSSKWKDNSAVSPSPGSGNKVDEIHVAFGRPSLHQANQKKEESLLKREKNNTWKNYKLGFSSLKLWNFGASFFLKQNSEMKIRKQKKQKNTDKHDHIFGEISEVPATPTPLPLPKVLQEQTSGGWPTFSVSIMGT